MRKFIAKTAAFLAMTTLISSPAIAQTSDGQTPAEETVCDVLQADGTTKGLYGLCVAFCEAHDITELSDPITEEELEALEAAAPSGKILENYNKKKQDGDPGMPCLIVEEEETCPCFTNEELSVIDGFVDGTQIDILGFAGNSPGISYIQERYPHSSAVVNDSFISFIGPFCRLSLAGPPALNRTLSINNGTLTPEEFEICRVKLNDHVRVTIHGN